MSDPSTPTQRHLDAAQRPHRWTLSDAVWPQHVSFISIDDQEVTLGDDFPREGIFPRYRCTLRDVSEGSFKTLIRKEFGADIWAEVLAEAQRRLARSAPPAPARAAAPPAPRPQTPAEPAARSVEPEPAASEPAPAAPALAAPTPKPVAAARVSAPSSAARQDVVLAPCERVSVPLMTSLITVVEGFQPADFIRALRGQGVAVVQRGLPAAAAATLCESLRLAGLPATTQDAA
jgi:hypothetical protein